MLGALDGRFVTDRSRRLTAPDIVAPAGGFTRDGALDAIGTSRAAFRQAVAAADQRPGAGRSVKRSAGMVAATSSRAARVASA
jgi:hypothetical protein